MLALEKARKEREAKQQDNFDKLCEVLQDLTDDVAFVDQDSIVFYVGDKQFDISYNCHDDILHVEISEQC